MTATAAIGKRKIRVGGETVALSHHLHPRRKIRKITQCLKTHRAGICEDVFKVKDSDLTITRGCRRSHLAAVCTPGAFVAAKTKRGSRRAPGWT